MVILFRPLCGLLFSYTLQITGYLQAIGRFAGQVDFVF